jgi:hypothetical protein
LELEHVAVRVDQVESPLTPGTVPRKAARLEIDGGQTPVHLVEVGDIDLDVEARLR